MDRDHPESKELTPEEWLERATRPPEPRHEADRVLMEFGHDPSLIEWFLTLSTADRLRSSQAWAQMAVRRRAELGLE
jgi:hypothetical protein